MPLRLLVIAGPEVGRELLIDSHDTFLVGRSSRAHFRLPDEDRGLSREHFLLEVNLPHCRLIDLGSRNGTYVNGEQVRVADLAHGDEVRAGHTLFRVSIEADEVPPTALPGEMTSEQKAWLAGWPTVPGYTLEREIGRGAMGIVYLARHLPTGELVALKTIRPELGTSPAQTRRFLREADILRQLDHPNIIRFRDLGEASGVIYFAMDYVEGIDVGQIVERHGQLAVRAAVRLLRQALKGLAYAHARGFVHRDIKPANLLLGRQGDRNIVQVADFGLARVYTASKLSGLTILNEIGGTVPFMAPEQVTSFRTTAPAADQYSAAATLYYLLTRHFTHSFTRDPFEQVTRSINEGPIPVRIRRPELPLGLAQAIDRALSRDPKERFEDVEELRRALRPFRK